MLLSEKIIAVKPVYWMLLNKVIQEECDQYGIFPIYVEKYYNNFSQKKVLFANKIKEYITLDNSSGILDLKNERLFEDIWE